MQVWKENVMRKREPNTLITTEKYVKARKIKALNTARDVYMQTSLAESSLWRVIGRKEHKTRPKDTSRSKRWHSCQGVRVPVQGSALVQVWSGNGYMVQPAKLPECWGNLSRCLTQQSSLADPAAASTAAKHTAGSHASSTTHWPQHGCSFLFSKN